VLPVLGRPLIAWAVDAALGSEYFGPGNVYVSTEDEEIAAAAESAGAQVVARPDSLAGDAVWTEPVIQHAVERIEEDRGRQVELVGWMNACLPELETADIDRAVERLRDEGLREVVSVDESGRSNSAIRVLRRETLFQQRLSVGFAVMRLDYMDIHTRTELDAVEARLRERAGSERSGSARPFREERAEQR
jgi:hypothetical protein